MFEGQHLSGAPYGGHNVRVSIHPTRRFTTPRRTGYSGGDFAAFLGAHKCTYAQTVSSLGNSHNGQQSYMPNSSGGACAIRIDGPRYTGLLGTSTVNAGDREWSPRFVKFGDPPRMSDITGYVHTKKKLDLHLKDAQAMSFPGLETLPIYMAASTATDHYAAKTAVENSRDCVVLYQESKRWLWDDTIYPPTTGVGPHVLSGQVKFDNDDWLMIGKAGRYESAVVLGEDVTKPLYVIGSVNYFSTDETQKARRRILGEPMWNYLITRDQLIRFSQSSKAKIRGEVERGRYTMQYDMKAWYDQIPLLSRLVQRRFGLSYGGQWWLLRMLPMGFRPACQIAQSITWMLCAFDHGCSISTMIDNVRFVSDCKKTLIAAGETFERRCATAGVQLNDSELTTAQRVKTSDTFCGEYYDFTSKERSLGTKTVDKVGAALDVLNNGKILSFRQVAALTSLAMYTADVLDVGLLNLSTAIRWYIKQCRHVTFNDGPATWSQPAEPMPGQVTLELRRHLQLSHDNVPIPVSGKQITSPDIVLITDASAIGWSVISLYQGSIRQFTGTWSIEETSKFNLRSSVTAESMCIGKAIGLVRGLVGAGGHIRVITDHAGAVFAFEKGYSDTTAYANMLAVALEARVHVSARFVPGVKNAADGGSRGAAEATDAEVEVSIGAAIRIQKRCKKPAPPWMC